MSIIHARTLYWGDQSPAQSINDEFTRNLAIVIGIERYAHVTPLPNAANDARALDEMLRKEHGFETISRLDTEATRDNLRALFKDLSTKLRKDDRLLVYFAGHGVALDGDRGFLVPYDGESNKQDSLLSYEDLRRWLSDLPCRHLLVLLDCCFAGSFQWSGKISGRRTRGDALYREQYRHWVDNPARQVITSTAFDQEALDNILIEDREYKLGSRGAAIAEHSPFTYGLLQVLGHPDDASVEPSYAQGGLITASALSGILQHAVTELAGGQQHPQTFTLDELHAGEYLFQLPGTSLLLDAAPTVGALTPWPGQRHYQEHDKRFFFGRDDDVAALVEHVTSHPITVLVGDSGVGKSSLLRAGLWPRLSSMSAEDGGVGNAWVMLPPMRPGDRPIMRLCAHLRAGWGKHVWQASGMDGSQLDGEALRRLVAAWPKANPKRRLLLIIDQFEDVFCRYRDEAERDSYLALLAELARAGSERLAVVLALRADFYPKLSVSPLGEVLAESHFRLVAPEPDELRSVIERPASLFGLFWDPESLPDTLVTDFGKEIGAQALVSMLLHGLSQDATPQERTLRGYQGDESFLRQQLNSVANKPGEEQQEALGQLLLRMIAPSDVQSDGAGFRGRSVQDDELVFGLPDVNARVQEALNRLIAARLVVASSQGDHAIYQLAHSKLAQVISERYRSEILGLQAAAAIPYKIRRELREAAHAWRPDKDDETHEDDESRNSNLWHENPSLPLVQDALWPAGDQGNGLRTRLSWEWRVLRRLDGRPSDSVWLNQTEVAFVRESLQRQAVATARRTGTVFGVMFILLIATVISLGLLFRALRAEATAKREAQIALSRALAANSSLELADGRYETALLLAIQSGQAAETDQTFDAIRAILRQPGRTEVITETKQVDCRVQVGKLQEQQGELLVDLEIPNSILLPSDPFLPSDSDFVAPGLDLGLGPDSFLTSMDPKTGNDIGYLRLVDPKTRDDIATLPYPFDWCLDCSRVRAFRSPNGERVLTVDLGGNALVWDLPPWDYWARKRDPVTLDHSRPMRTYTDEQGQEHILADDLLNFSRQGGPLLAGAWDPSGKRVVTTGCSNLGTSDASCALGRAWVWDAVSGRSILSLVGHSDWVCEPRWLGDWNRIRTNSSDGEREWTLEAGSELPVLSREAGDAQALQPAKPACSLSETQLQAGLSIPSSEFADMYRRTTCVRDRIWVRGMDGAALMDSSILPVLPSSGEPVFDAHVSPDGDRIALARCKRKEEAGSSSVVFCDEGVLEVRDAYDGRLLTRLSVTGKKATLVSWNQDGTRLLVATDDNEDILLKDNPRVTVVDAASWEEVISITGLARVPYRIAWSQDGRRVLVFDSEGARQFHLSITDLVDSACNLAPRNFEWEEWNRFSSEPYQPTCQDKLIPTSAVDGMLGLVKQQIAAGEVNEARERLSQLNLWLADSGQLESYGIVPDQFIAETLAELRDENATKGLR